METNQKQTTVGELKRRFEEAQQKEAERIAAIRGTPKELFRFKIDATLSVTKTIEVAAESQAHAEALIDDQIDRGEHFEVRDDEGPWGCEDWRVKLLSSETLVLQPQPLPRLDPNQGEMPL